MDAQKEAIKAHIEACVRGRTEIGLNDLRRRLAWELPADPWAQDGRFVAKMLNALGWRRDGWLGTGYDREARYVPIWARG